MELNNLSVQLKVVVKNLQIIRNLEGTH